MIDIDKLEALEKAATPGPWQVIKMQVTMDDGEELTEIYMGAAVNVDGTIRIVETDSAEDEELILAMRNSLPELLAEVRRLRQVEEGLENIWEPPD